MIIQSYGNDIPILVFKQVFEDNIIFTMLKEIETIIQKNLLKSGQHTASAIDHSGQYKSNVGIFLDELYENRRHESEILTIHNNIVNVMFNTHLLNRNIVFKYFNHTQSHHTLVSAYLDGGSYFTHTDESVLTSVTFLWNQPKKFSGGSLLFKDYDILFEPDLGDVVIFPGFCSHEVNEVTLAENNLLNARYSVSQFFNMI